MLQRGFMMGKNCRQKNLTYTAKGRKWSKNKPTATERLRTIWGRGLLQNCPILSTVQYNSPVPPLQRMVQYSLNCAQCTDWNVKGYKSVLSDINLNVPLTVTVQSNYNSEVLRSALENTRKNKFYYKHFLHYSVTRQVLGSYITQSNSFHNALNLFNSLRVERPSLKPM